MPRKDGLEELRQVRAGMHKQFPTIDALVAELRRYEASRPAVKGPKQRKLIPGYQRSEAGRVPVAPKGALAWMKNQVNQALRNGSLKISAAGQVVDGNNETDASIPHVTRRKSSGKQPAASRSRRTKFRGLSSRKQIKN
jgi:hypothetical protein